jgi:hypothetical protein
MPRKPRKTRECKRVFTPSELAYLTDDSTVEEGFTLLCYHHGNTGWDDDREPQELWAENRAEFLPMFIEKNPGCRPLPWWQWDAPDGWRESLSFVDKYKALVVATIRANWPREKQEQYLLKHNLLTKSEAKSLKNEAIKNE